MHINPLVGIVELLRDDGEPAGNGESGRVVVTGIAKRSMPLIRYDLGDLAVSTGYAHRCRCGLQWPSIGRIDGREEEQIVARDGGRFTHLMRFAVKGLAGIRESQLVQVDYESFVMKIVEDRGGDRERRRNEASIRHEIERRMGTKVDIAFEYVKEIPRSEGGKFKAMVSAMGQERDMG
jgi:phenylacetate-CoA ligase